MVKKHRSKDITILTNIFSFPDTVNEYAARFVAAFVVILSITYLLTQNLGILIFLIYGFLARVLTGPTLSPIALLVTKIIIPIIGNPQLLCPGPPKRFAQMIGLIFTSSTLYFVYISQIYIANLLLYILIFFALLESFFGFCTGCWVFKKMMNFGLIPQKICNKCESIGLID